MNDLERVGRHIVRTFYDPLPANDGVDPIWCLGQRYDAKESSISSSTSHVERSGDKDDDSWIRTSVEESERHGPSTSSEVSVESRTYGGWPQQFLDDFESRIWLTYRSGFAQIPKSQDPKATAAMSFRVRLQTLSHVGFTSDSGFGCMIRTGQCILANALASLKLERDWRFQRTTSDEESSILALFADDPRAPFSIHRFVQHGAAVCGKYPGEWFGPSATARCIQDLVHSCGTVGLRVYSTSDGADIYEDSFMDVAKGDSDVFHPTLILVGTRLGIDKITPVYWEALKSSLQMVQSIGIAGGRPSASHYFVGTQGNHFFYLDPHETRPFLPYHENPKEYNLEDISACHTRRLRRIEIREMDPSMLIAFLIRDEDEWKDWKKAIVSVQGKAIVNVAKSKPPSSSQVERQEAIDEVESFDERDDDM